MTGKKKLSSQIVIFAIVMVNVLVFLSVGSEGADMAARYGLSGTTLMNGELYRCVTYMFMHGNILHIASNMITLSVIGYITCGVFGSKRFLIIYFASGILAGVESALFRESVGNSNLFTVGASGAIYGLIAIVAILLWKSKQKKFAVVNVMVLWLGTFFSFIDTTTHLAGAFFGICLYVVFAYIDNRSCVSVTQ